MRVREAEAQDAQLIARLHARSWREHYRGAYADSFLDGDLVANREEVWAKRFSERDGTVTFVAEDGPEFIGFVHVFLDHDPRWGSLIDNLHVVTGRHRSGTGKALMTQASQAVTKQAASPARYLWVLEQNVAAQGFYAALGGVPAETGFVPDPGGVPGRLNGKPRCVRMVWDAKA